MFSRVFQRATCDVVPMAMFHGADATLSFSQGRDDEDTPTKYGN